jgi:aspartyl-tRNA(Asn)/glutamyl-tRNA(Gln) amidotransferase subunit B
MASTPEIVSSRLVVGLEVHVELATRTKMFTRAPNPAYAGHFDAEPNTLIDPVVLGLPGALPVLNKAAIEMSMTVGLALGCSIAEFTKCDRKNYYYPDLPKGYQISQYDLPLCFDGAVDLPIGENDKGEPVTRRIGIIRAHLEEDAGKSLHEAPGGGKIDFSIVDFNRAGAPLLEIVTQPDFHDADEVVRFAQLLRNVCRWLGVSEGDMQKGHMRFEPNINAVLELSDGRIVKTPIVEIKNLNSFRAVKAAIEHEFAEQPKRWLKDGRVMGPGAKRTRGWDDVRLVTVEQREKEDAHEYRYFPEPDLLPVVIDDEWRERVRSAMPELPHVREARHRREFNLGAKEAAALNNDRAVSDFFERAVAILATGGHDREQGGRKIANLLLQSGSKRANEQNALITDLGITEEQVVGIVLLRDENKINSSAADELFGILCDSSNTESPEAAAGRHGLLQIRDESQMEAWCDEAIAANPKSADDYRGGKQSAIGALVGAVMKASKGQADPKAAREILAKKLS